MFQMVLIDRNIQLNLHDAVGFFSSDSCVYFFRDQWKSTEMDSWFTSVHPSVDSRKNSERLGRQSEIQQNLHQTHIFLITYSHYYFIFTCHLMNLMGADKIPAGSQIPNYPCIFKYWQSKHDTNALNIMSSISQNFSYSHQ